MYIPYLLSKDNFWNLVVYFGIVLTVFAGEQLESATIFICAFTITPYILTRFNKVRYLEDGRCINSQGDDLSDRLPRALPLIIALDAMLVSFKFFGLIAKTPDGFKGTVALGIIALLPILYFIIKNCPISILFNLEALSRNRIGATSCSFKTNSMLHTRPMNNSHAHSSSRNELITSPVYSHLPQNVYHSNHNRRY